jgi:homocitrate synthase NifV
MEVEFRNEDEAKKILELVRYANVHNQKPLVESELSFVAKYPDIAKKIFTMNPGG